MRRVVVTGLGIVSSIGNNANEVLASLREAKSGRDRRAGICRTRFPLPGPRRAPDRRLGSPGGPPGGALPGPWHGLCPHRHGAGDRRLRPLEEAEVSNERTGLIVGSGGPSTRVIVEAAATTKEKGPKRIGPFAVPKAMSSGSIGGAVDLVQDPRDQLFDQLGLRDQRPLHRRGRRADPDGQAGRDLRRRLRGAGLEPVEPVRRHGRHEQQLQRPTGRGQPRL